VAIAVWDNLDTISAYSPFLDVVRAEFGDEIPAIGEIWEQGENDLAVTTRMVGAILVPIVLMLAIERVVRNLSFREI
jgi:hypothetical protein